MKRIPILATLLAASLATGAPLEETVISADFSPRTLGDTPNSVTVISSGQIAALSASALDELLGQAPNVNSTSGASRGKYFQIRGVGERSQFVDPVNPGVGLLIDGIDFSTLGGAATLFDIERVEVLRGPQGTRYGANALGGVIQLLSNRPTEQFEGELSSGFGDSAHNDGTLDSWRVGAVLSGPLRDSLLGRIAVQQVTSDGFVNNRYLGRDDTNAIDELTARGHLAWQASDALSFDLTALLLEIDNGYDAFTLDNALDTNSDQPGSDTQSSMALGITSSWQFDPAMQLQTALSYADSDTEYSYDEDWTNPSVCVGLCEGWEYSGFDRYLRDTQTGSADIRLVGGDRLDWVAGIYGRDQSVDLDRDETFSGAFDSRYETRNLALYGQVGVPVSDSTRLGAGLRLERFDADYRDSTGERFSPGESLWGGHVTVERDLDSQSMVYLRVARGYKSGGANSEGSSVLPVEFKSYDTEYLWNYEIGFRGESDSGEFGADLALFYLDRTDAQIKQSFVVQPCPCTAFTDYTDNAPSAYAYGVEAQLRWQQTAALGWSLTLGLLNAEFERYLSYSHIEADLENNVPLDLEGRELAQSPDWQYALSMDWQPLDVVRVVLNWESRDSYYFSNRHNAQSDSYGLLHGRVSWSMDALELSLWGRNLTDERYRTRGFGSFGNDPRDGYQVNNYYQFGNPREIGVGATYRF